MNCFSVKEICILCKILVGYGYYEVGSISCLVHLNKKVVTKSRPTMPKAMPTRLETSTSEALMKMSANPIQCSIKLCAVVTLVTHS